MQALSSTLTFSEAGDARSDAVAITDLSALSGFGCKGPRAESALRSLGIPLPGDANSWMPFRSEGVVLRLGRSEFLFQDEPGANTTCELRDKIAGSAGVYPVLRHDLVLALTGPRLSELFARTCSFDFREFERKPDLVVMTTMLGVSVTLIACEFASRRGFRLWCDGTYGIYFLAQMLSIAEELGGGAADFCDLHTNARSPLTPSLHPQEST